MLATHHAQQAVPRCGYVVKLDAGRVEARGTAGEFPSKGIVDAHTAELGADTDAWESDGEAAKTSSEDTLENERKTKATPSDPVEPKDEGAVSWSIVSRYIKDLGSRWSLDPGHHLFAAQQLALLGAYL